MNLTITFADSETVMAVEVSPDMTVADLRVYAQEEAGFKVNPGATLIHNGHHLQDQMTLEKAGLHDNDMVQLSAIAGVYSAAGDAAGGSSASAGSAGSYTQQPPPSAAGAAAGAGGASGAAGSKNSNDSTLALQIEAARQQILYDPQLFAQLSQQSPELADALHDPEQFQKAYRTLHQQQMRVKAENDEIDRNFRLALEEMPEAFTTVSMLFANIEVNGIPVKAFIDSGAQTTIMSPECAERCHLSHLIDKRHRGMAYGVGQATILGRIHMAPIKIGSSYFACSMTVIEGTNMEFLLGLDMLKHHQAILDLKHNRLVMGNEELPFLEESEIPKNLIGPPGSAGPAIVSKPGTDLPRGALNNIGGVVGNGSNNSGSSGSSSSSRKDAGSSSSQQQQQRSSSTSSRQRGMLPIAPLANSSNSTQNQNQNQNQTASFDENVVANLMSLGFSDHEVRRALAQTGGNADLAASLLFGE